MSPLRIFCDLRLTEDEILALREKIVPHELLVPRRLSESVIADGDSDPALLAAHVAVGQPPPDALLAAPYLRWLQITTAGFTRYDNPEFRAQMAARQIAVCNSSDVYAEACAEHVFAFMLAQSRSLLEALQDCSVPGSRGWNCLRASNVPLKNQSVVILGYGGIAERLVQMLAPFQMRIVAMRRQARGDESVPIVLAGDLPEALRHADHVINILPQNAGSQGFFDEDRFAQMKKGAIFYNIGRGPTVDQAALLKVLRSGHLGTAWLDVTEPEPLPTDHPLRAEPRCHITPHVAGGHQNETQTIVDHFLANLRRFERGEPLRNRVM